MLPKAFRSNSRRKNRAARTRAKAEKEANRELSRVRVVIEHLISGAKRLRIVKEEMRLKVENVSDDLMEIACGTHNFRNLMRKPFFKELLLQQIYYA